MQTPESPKPEPAHDAAKSDSAHQPALDHLIAIRSFLDNRIADGQWRELRDRAAELGDGGDFEGAIRTAQEALKIVEANFSPEDERAAVSHLLIGRFELRTEQAVAAEVSLTRAVTILEEAKGSGARETAIARSDLASALSAQARLPEAQQELQKAVGILEAHAAIGGERCEAAQDLARVLGQYAICFEDQNKPAEARFYHAKAVEKSQEAFGDVSEEAAVALCSSASFDIKRGNVKAAAVDLEYAVEMFEQLFGPSDSRYSYNAIQLAIALRSLGRNQEAYDLGKRVLPYVEQPSLANASNTIALAAFELGKPAEAKPFFQKAIELESARVGSVDSSLAPLYYNLGCCHRQLGERSEAEQALNTAIKLTRAVSAESAPSLMAMERALAGLYVEQGKPFKAEGVLHRLFAACERNLAPDSPQALNTLRELISVAIGNGNLNDAAKLNDKLIGRTKNLGGPFELLYADALDNAAGIALSKKEYESAEELFRQELAIQRRLLPTGDVSIAHTLQNIAQTYLGQERYSMAAGEIKASLKIFEAALGRKSHNVANSIHLLGRVNHEGEDFETAEELYEEALQIHESLLGPSGGLVMVPVLNDYASMLRDLGTLYAREEDLEQSLSLFTRAREILTAVGRDEHLTMVAVLRNTAAVLDALDRGDEAEALRREADVTQAAIEFRNEDPIG